ncbi:MAG: HD domain-containing protein [Oscillospiraceae bacterium]|nr:HD domain-containing protein [Oscillospiraceae bacterium]
MIYTKLTMRAMAIAYAAHHGQVDKAGMPYIFHPMHLAEQMSDEYSTCAALLHDTVEDTDVTIGDLEAEFPREVTEAIRLLTHEKGTDYLEYVRSIKGNPIALAVKLADLAHNSDETRLDGTDMSEEIREYFRKKYAAARAVLCE